MLLSPIDVSPRKNTVLLKVCDPARVPRNYSNFQDGYASVSAVNTIKYPLRRVLETCSFVLIIPMKHVMKHMQRNDEIVYTE